MAVASWLVSSIWANMPAMVLCMVSIMVRMLSMLAMNSGNWASSCGMIASNSSMFFANLVNTVDRIKYGSERPADGNVVARRFPVEVIADRPPEIVEIRNVIPQLFRGRLQLMRMADHAMSRVGHLLHQVVHVLHYVDHCRQIVGLLEHVVHAG